MTPERKQVQSQGGGRPALMVELGVETWANVPMATFEHMMRAARTEREKVLGCVLAASFGFGRDLECDRAPRVCHPRGPERGAAVLAVTMARKRLRPLTQAEMARRLGMARQNVDTTLTSLESDGYLHRKRNGKTDIRIWVFATPNAGAAKPKVVIQLDDNWKFLHSEDPRLSSFVTTYIQRSYALKQERKSLEQWARSECAAMNITLRQVRASGMLNAPAETVPPLAATLQTGDGSRLAEFLGRRGFGGVSAAYCSSLRLTLAETPLEYFEQRVVERMQRGRFGTGLLLHLAKDARRDFELQCRHTSEATDRRPAGDLASVRELLNDPQLPAEDRRLIFEAYPELRAADATGD